MSQGFEAVECSHVSPSDTRLLATEAAGRECSPAFAEVWCEDLICQNALVLVKMQAPTSPLTDWSEPWCRAVSVDLLPVQAPWGFCSDQMWEHWPASQLILEAELVRGI